MCVCEVDQVHVKICRLACIIKLLSKLPLLDFQTAAVSSTKRVLHCCRTLSIISQHINCEYDCSIKVKVATYKASMAQSYHLAPIWGACLSFLLIFKVLEFIVCIY